MRQPASGGYTGPRRSASGAADSRRATRDFLIYRLEYRVANRHALPVLLREERRTHHGEFAILLSKQRRADPHALPIRFGQEGGVRASARPSRKDRVAAQDRPRAWLDTSTPDGAKELCRENHHR